MRDPYQDQVSTRFDSQPQWQSRLARVLAITAKRRLERAVGPKLEPLGPLSRFMGESSMFLVMTFIEDIFRSAPDFILGNLKPRGPIPISRTEIIDIERITSSDMITLGALVKNMSPIERVDFKRAVLNDAARTFVGVMSSDSEGRALLAEENHRTVRELLRDWTQEISDYLGVKNKGLKNTAERIKRQRQSLRIFPFKWRRGRPSRHL